MKTVTNDDKGFSAVELVLVLTVVILIGAVGWLVYDRQKDKTATSLDTKMQTQSNKKQQKTDVSTREYTAPAGYKKYTDNELGISLYYPESFDEIYARKPEYIKENVKLFDIARAPITENLEAPGEFGPSAYLRFENNKWYSYGGYDGSTDGLEFSGRIAKSDATSVPVVYDEIAEGGGWSYMILIVSDTYVYRIVLPKLSDEDDSEKTFRDHRVATPKIIESIRFTN